MRKLLHTLKSDESLMLAYQHGDSSAFDVLYGRHKDILFAFLYRSCGQAAVVEELAQDTWMAIIRRAESYQPKAKFKTYLFQVAHHKLIDHWRQHKHLVSQVDITEVSIGDTESDLEDARIQQRVEDTLTRALATLPAPQRDVFLLREQGFSQEQIGLIVGAGKETVKSRLRYAGNQLQALLESSFVEAGQEIPPGMTGASNE